MPEPEDPTITFNLANADLLKETLLAAIVLGNAVDAYFAFYGYTEHNRERMMDPDRLMWDALQKWRGLSR